MTGDPELLVIVPSRGRPEAVADLMLAADKTCSARTEFAFAVDADDPSLIDYARTAGRHLWRNFGEKTMVAALNGAATGILSSYTGTYAVAFMGDDHRPRTFGWDRDYLDALHERGTGIVYGDDLLRGEQLPTQVAMTADIVRSLGYMAPPGLTHLFVDDYWKALGEGAGCLQYLPHVIVEHLHPIAGKAPWTEGHLRVNALAMYQHDHEVYSRYAQLDLLADIAKVKALR